LRLLYQPKVELASGRVTGVEALVRWVHPATGRDCAAAFHPFAEQTGFIKTITRWGHQRGSAAGQGVARRGPLAPGGGQHFSAGSVDARAPEIVTAALKAHDAPASTARLEVTESGVMQDAAHAIEVMHSAGADRRRPRDRRFRHRLFLARLHQAAAVDEIKIDRSFVRNIMNDKKDMAIVLSTVELCHNLGLIVVAEGWRTPCPASS
jgi:EAL domain-containing protein (putative c-di-GMP-specific phosphodiesterase class I)